MIRRFTGIVEFIRGKVLTLKTRQNGNLDFQLTSKAVEMTRPQKFLLGRNIAVVVSRYDNDIPVVKEFNFLPDSAR